MTRKGDVIQSLIEASRFRKQLRYATAKGREDVALQTIDNIFALHEKAIRALIKRASPRKRKAP